MIPYGQKDFPHQVRPQADPYDTHKELTAMNIQTACAADTAKIYRIMTEARSLAPYRLRGIYTVPYRKS